MKIEKLWILLKKLISVIIDGSKNISNINKGSIRRIKTNKMIDNKFEIPMVFNLYHTSLCIVCCKVLAWNAVISIVINYMQNNGLAHWQF